MTDLESRLIIGNSSPATRNLSDLDRLRPVSLQEVLAEADLQDRVDRKYLLDANSFSEVVDRLMGTHQALEFAHGRTCLYNSVYFDSADLRCHRDHVQKRRRRWKARTRHYVDSDLTRLELKVKGLGGRTRKLRQDIEPLRHGVIDDAATSFIDDGLRSAYGHGLSLELLPVLEIVYRRATLVDLEAGERLTIDHAVSFASDGRSAHARLRPSALLIESKSGQRPGRADEVLRSIGVRPVSCSKYCLGTATGPFEASAPDLLPVLRRWFEPTVGAPSWVRSGASTAPQNDERSLITRSR